MYKQLLIITKQKINEELLNNFDYLIINDDINNYSFNNYYQINYNSEDINFDYLIIDKPLNNVLMEDNYIITNQYLESSIDNYFIIGPYNKSNKTIDDQIIDIIDYINGNI